MKGINFTGFFVYESVRFWFLWKILLKHFSVKLIYIFYFTSFFGLEFLKFSVLLATQFSGSALNRSYFDIIFQQFDFFLFVAFAQDVKIESNGLSMPEFFLVFATQFLKSLMNLNNQTEKLMLISIKICKKIVLNHACVLVPSFTPFVKSVGNNDSIFF